MPGVTAVVRDGVFIGVVAEREEQAIRAQRRLARLARWQETASLPESADPRFLFKRASEDEVISEKADAASLARATKTLVAEFSRGFMAHAALAKNLCRCGTHQRILRAIKHAAIEMRK